MNNDRTRLAAPCFLVAQEHHQAILLLLTQAHPLHAPAFALVRPVFEAYVRGAWLARCANTPALEAFSQGNAPPNMENLIAAIEQLPEFGTRQISEVYNLSWATMCSYTHSGSQQVCRWNTSDAIQSNYSDEEVDEILVLTGVLALQSTLGLAVMADNESLAANVLAKAREFSYQFESNSKFQTEYK